MISKYVLKVITHFFLLNFHNLLFVQLCQTGYSDQIIHFLHLICLYDDLNQSSHAMQAPILSSKVPHGVYFNCVSSSFQAFLFSILLCHVLVVLYYGHDQHG